MARISFSDHGKTPFERLLGHNPQILESWSRLEDLFLSSNTFTPEFKEEIRRTMAHLNGCHYCMAKGKPSEHLNDRRITAATTFAKRFAQAHKSILDQDVESLRQDFTEAEISELCALIAFFSASQKFGASLALTESCLI